MAINRSCWRDWGGRVTLVFPQVYYRDHLISKTVSLIESYLTLSYVLP